MSFWQDKKVLIAGASGMTGHNLYDYLQQQLATVIGTCNSSNDYYSDGQPMFTPVDFTSKVNTDEFFSTIGAPPDYVFICCAQTYNAQMCRDNPQLMILPNIQMVSNILENCLKRGVKKVLYISSATVYQPTDTPLGEEDLDLNKNPHDLYLGVGWAKRYMEKLCEFYASKGLKVVVVRPTNIYGRYDKTDEKKCHVVPALIMRALRKENPYVLKSQGNGVKNFIHVNDLVRDLSTAMEKQETPEAINLTSDEYHSIANVVDLILEVMKERDPSYQPEVRLEGSPDAISFIGIKRTKFDTLSGGEKYKSLKEGLREVIDWYSLLPPTQN